MIQAAFKRLNANTPAVENKRFYSAFNPIPPPFPIHGKGGGSGGYIPRRAGGVAQPGQAVKGKPPQAALLRTLDRQLPPVLNSRRRRGIYHQSTYVKMRGDNDCFGTFCLEATMRYLDFSGRMAGAAGAALITKAGRPPVDSGHIAQKNRPIFKDGFLRNVIVSIFFFYFRQKPCVFVFLIRVIHISDKVFPSYRPPSFLGFIIPLWGSPVKTVTLHFLVFYRIKAHPPVVNK